MKPTETFLWHDYETFGAEPLVDRPVQFAAQRTDRELNPIGEPVTWFCAPADDVLPHPAACLITGITPQDAKAKGLPETEFAAHILAEMMQPGTCSAGFNSIRFDDVVTRSLLYRNLRNPYEREYANGNSRWDIIDLARMCYALRPDGVEWPMRSPESTDDPSPVPSFKLEDLTRANSISHDQAHDALADVQATIGLARRLKTSQPRLFEWALGLRDQKSVMALLDPTDGKPFLHTSSRIPARRGCTTLELPLAVLPDRPKSVVAFDLMGDPTPLIREPAEVIADLVFTPRADLPEGVERLPLKLIHSNHVPMVAPASTLRDTDAARIQLDIKRCHDHARLLSGNMPAVRAKVLEVFARPGDDEAAHSASPDPDLMLYSGGFFSAGDRHLMKKILEVPPGELAQHVWGFSDRRLPLMLFRFRARNYPDTLTAKEREAWDQDRVRRLIHTDNDRRIGLAQFLATIAEFRVQHRSDAGAQRILDQLESWAFETGLVRLAEAASRGSH